MPPRKKDPLSPPDASVAPSVEEQAAPAADSGAIQAPEKQRSTRRRRTAASAPAQGTETAAAAQADQPAASRKRPTSRKTAGKKADVASLAETEAPAEVPVEDRAPLIAQEASGSDRQASPVLPHLLETTLNKKERKETHEKDRVYLRKDLKERLERVSAGRSKGFKTLLLNYGLEKALDELEKAEAALNRIER